MGRKCDKCEAPALVVVVDAATGAPVGRLRDELGYLPILDTTRPVRTVQERFCRLHRRKLMKEMERTGYLTEVEPRSYITSDMTDNPPPSRITFTPHGDLVGADEDE